MRAGLLSRERSLVQDADALGICGRQHWAHRKREMRSGPARSKTLARTETLRTRTGRSWVLPSLIKRRDASGSPRTHADDERAQEVGQSRSTDEVAEQGRATGGGGGGGKGTGQGEPAPAKRAPDTAPDQRVQYAGASTAGSIRALRWRYHLRQEPDAVIPHVRIRGGGHGQP